MPKAFKTILLASLVAIQVVCTSPCVLGQGTPRSYVPSEPPFRYTGQTKQLTSRAGRLPQMIVGALDFLAVEYNVKKHLDALMPEIRRQMPAEGGVLVIVEVAQSKHVASQCVYSSFVAATGKTLQEAETAYRQSQDRPVVKAAPPEGYQHASSRFHWFPAPKPHAQVILQLSDEQRRALTLLERFEAELQPKFEAETARLDDEWKLIEVRNSHLNALKEAKRDAVATLPLSPEEAEARDRARAAETQQQRQRDQLEIRRLTDAAHQGDQQINALTVRLRTMVYDRCPNSAPFDQCTHQDLKRAFSADQSALMTQVREQAESVAAIRRRIAAIRERLAAEPQREQRRAEALRENDESARKEIEDIQESIDDLSESLRERIDSYNMKDEEVRCLGEFLEDVRKMRRTLLLDAQVLANP